MRIVTCTKGGKIPDGYCRESCLNYSGQSKNTKKSLGRLKKVIIGKKKPLIQVYKEDVCLGNDPEA